MTLFDLLAIHIKIDFNKTSVRLFIVSLWIRNSFAIYDNVMIYNETL